VTVADKTRKILWARSGNRCAICRRELVVDKTNADPEAIVGDECHIVSKLPDGPRSTFRDDSTTSDLDGYGNLILLCRTHHKLVDDQPGKYTVPTLKAVKSLHEQWVSESLEKNRRGAFEGVSEPQFLNTEVISETARLIEEVESRELSDLEKFALFAVEIGRRHLPIQTITFSTPKFWGWLRAQVQECGRGAVYVSLDTLGYLPANQATGDLAKMIAKYDLA